MRRAEFSCHCQRGFVCHVTSPWICKRCFLFLWRQIWVWEGRQFLPSPTRTRHSLHWAATSILTCLEIALIKASSFWEFRDVMTFSTCLGTRWLGRKSCCFSPTLVSAEYFCFLGKIPVQEMFRVHTLPPALPRIFQWHCPTQKSLEMMGKIMERLQNPKRTSFIQERETCH